LYEKPYRNPGPTKIPAGRLEITVGSHTVFQRATLDLAQATARLEIAPNIRAEVFVHASEPAGLIKIDTNDTVNARLIVPDFGGRVKNPEPGNTRVMEVSLLGYTPQKKLKGKNWSGYLQKGWEDFSFAVVFMWERTENQWWGVWSISSSLESDDPFQKALSVCQKIIKNGYEISLKEHTEWWNKFWGASSVCLPNPLLESLWYQETYKFGAAARPDTPPITLQGPWTADNGLLPPWKGDYHHDLNTELSYWPAYSGNHMEGAKGYVRWLWETKPNAEAWTRRFFDLPGLNVPMTADLNQEQIGGWHQYTHSATTAAWLAHHFYLHWRYSMDRNFLKSRVYPWFRDAAVFFAAVTEKGKDGKRTLPLSSSPEINDNRLEAWFSSITNYDLALIRFVFEKSAEIAGELGLLEESKKWGKLLKEMPELALDPDSGKMLVAQGHPLTESHRHFSHLMAIHPLGMIRWENGPADQKIIEASLAELEQLGSENWVGYSFSWLANLAARARDGKRAEKALEIFSKAFRLRNGFHCNGDQSGKGYSRFTYRPFTLEGNFAAAAGIQEMLIQSYSGIIRVFPAVPKDWLNVSFKTLRAEGAFLVSAKRDNGQTTSITIQAEKDGLCAVENPLGEDFDILDFNTESIKREKKMLRFPMKAGQKIIMLRKGNKILE
jgi:alpha-L-fucosidase 2